MNAYIVAGCENGSLFVDGGGLPNVRAETQARTLSPTCVVAGTEEVWQLFRATFEDASRQEVGTGGAIVTEASLHCHTLLNRRADNRRLELKALVRTV